MTQTTGLTLLGDLVVPRDKALVTAEFRYRPFLNLEAPFFTDDIASVPLKAGTIHRSHFFPEIFKNAIFCLANNHTMDYGERGLTETLQICRKHNVTSVGAGRDLSEAQKPYIFEDNGVRVGILARTDPQFGNAGLSNAGVAPLDCTVFSDIRKLKAQVDVVILHAHGTSEVCPWPSPSYQDMMRECIHAGASLVHGTHAHIPQGIEEYEEGLICYGLGNVMIEPNVWRRNPNAFWSVAVNVEMDRKGVKGYKLDFLEITDEDVLTVSSARPQNIERYTRYLATMSEPLKDREYLVGLWQEYSVRLYRAALGRQLGFEKKPFLAGMNQLRKNWKGHKASESSATKEQLLLWYHLFAADAHRDVIANALGVLGGEIVDKRDARTRRMADDYIIL